MKLAVIIAFVYALDQIADDHYPLLYHCDNLRLQFALDHAPKLGHNYGIDAMAGILRNPQHEIFAQARAAGCNKDEAYQKAGYKGKSAGVQGRIDNKLEVRQRIKEILEASARRAELSRRDILDRIYQDWELCRKLGQMSASLKAAELMGKELHKMFVDRRETGGPGDFDNKTEEELREIVRDGLKDLGWDQEEENIPPSAIN